MKPKVIVYKKVDLSVLHLLREHCELTYYEKLDAETYPTFVKQLHHAHGLMGSGLKVDKALLEQAPHLKVVSNISVGYDNLDLPELSARGIMATNTPNVLNDTVADTIMGIMLAAARRITELDRYVKDGKWKSQIGEKEFGVDVHHKTLGIIGMGGIGASIAQRAYFGFGMNILYHNRSRKPEYEQKYSARYCSMDELLQQSDFVCLMTPLTPETVKLIGEREFKLMKKSAIFINGSRGATVDEDALVHALKNKEILAAGLDVYLQEPVPEDHPLLSLENAVTVPHIGSATYETRMGMAMLAAENLISGLRGELPPNLLNKEFSK
ncbi:2-hydroxyacid dehydrogenase [Marinicrinis lubricantis]|uniref:2-hydroxyacid dehydrogenase n=1 Tax=Marinicrinis lubricantis TaxID=2086470 RepID=A0ABW1ISR2_9BACL